MSYRPTVDADDAVLIDGAGLCGAVGTVFFSFGVYLTGGEVTHALVATSFVVLTIASLIALSWRGKRRPRPARPTVRELYEAGLRMRMAVGTPEDEPARLGFRVVLRRAPLWMIPAAEAMRVWRERRSRA